MTFQRDECKISVDTQDEEKATQECDNGCKSKKETFFLFIRPFLAFQHESVL